MAALQPGERALDVACGTGIVARTAARRLGSGGSVVGLDLSAPMLAVARSAATAEGVAIEWREGSALQLPLADGAFDVVFCQQGLQFFPDRPAALREMYRVLAPGRHVGPAAGILMTSGPFGLSSTEELRKLIARANFKDINIRPAAKVLHYPAFDEFVLRYAAGSALAGAVADADDNARNALLAEVAERLQSHVGDQGLAFSIESNIVTAHR